VTCSVCRVISERKYVIEKNAPTEDRSRGNLYPQDFKDGADYTEKFYFRDFIQCA
jgi:hypothetical protein